MSGFRFQTTEHSNSCLEQFDPRSRLLLALLVAGVAVSLTSLPALLLIFLYALLFVVLAQVSWRLVLPRMLAFEGFMLLVLVFLPFTITGEPVWQWGAFVASEQGLQRAAQIILRANSVVLVLLTLLGSIEPMRLGHALARLHLPLKFIHLFLFTVRYISVLSDEFQRLRTAMRARAFVARSNLHTWRSLGWLIGMLLVRSMERAQRIHAAMLCRGFNGRFYLVDSLEWRQRDTALLVVGMLSLIAPLWVQIWGQGWL